MCSKDFLLNIYLSHIKPLEAFCSRGIGHFADELDATKVRILTGIFGEPLGLTKVIRKTGIVRLQNVYNKATGGIIIFPDNDEIRECRLGLIAHLVWYLESPRSIAIRVTKPAYEIRAIALFIEYTFFPTIQLDLCDAQFVYKKVVFARNAGRVCWNLDVKW